MTERSTIPSAGPRLLCILATLAVFAGCITPSAAAPGVATAAGAPNGIEVVAEGEAEAVPDVAVFTIGVEARAPTMDAARTSGASAQQAVLDTLLAAGIGKEQIKTVRLSVGPDYDYTEGGRVLRGYVVSNQIEARMLDTKRLQSAIDASLKAGGDFVRFDGLRFELSDRSTIEEIARRKAVEAARAKARQLAKLLDVDLGAPVAIEELAGNEPPVVPLQVERLEASQAANTPVEPGSMRVRVTLRARWEINR